MTVRLFLRELRGVWPEPARRWTSAPATAARHLGLASARPRVTGLAGLAAGCGLDVRDLESGLVRLGLAHGRAMTRCPGGPACTALRPPVPQGAS